MGNRRRRAVLLAVCRSTPAVGPASAGPGPCRCPRSHIDAHHKERLGVTHDLRVVGGAEAAVRQLHHARLRVRARCARLARLPPICPSLQCLLRFGKEGKGPLHARAAFTRRPSLGRRFTRRPMRTGRAFRRRMPFALTLQPLNLPLSLAQMVVQRLPSAKRRGARARPHALPSWETRSSLSTPVCMSDASHRPSSRSSFASPFRKSLSV